MSEQEKLFLLMEHAEQLQAVAMTQQQELTELAKRVDSAVRNIKGPLATEASKEISAAVAEEAKEQIRQLRDLLTAAQSDVKERRLNIWLTLIGAAMLSLLVVTYGAWHGYRVTQAREMELAAIRAKISEAEETLEKLEGKTWGLKLDQNQNGARWITLPSGWKFGPFATMDKNAAIFVLPQ